MATDMELEKLQRADHDALIRVETKIDSFISGQADHEARLRVVENAKDSLAGTITGLKIALGLVFAVAGVIEPVIIFLVSRGQ